MQINANLEAKLWGGKGGGLPVAYPRQRGGGRPATECEKFLGKNIVKTVKQADQPWRILVSRSVKNFYFKVPYKQFLQLSLERV